MCDSSIKICEGKFKNLFTVNCNISSGSFGKVFEVKSKKDEKLFAIKKIAIRKDDFETINQEIKILVFLKSEYVVKYLDSWIEEKIKYGKVEKYAYIQMELCIMNLQNFIDTYHEEEHCIRYRKLSQIIIQTIESLNYLHSKRIIHRDLKPQNILICQENNGRFIKLCDFGLSKFLEKHLNSRGKGTCDYMAPEVKTPDNFDPQYSNYNEKCDIYSLGVIICKLFKFNIRSLHLNTLNVTIFCENLQADLKEQYFALIDIVKRCLADNPTNRPSCKELLGSKHNWTFDNK